MKQVDRPDLIELAALQPARSEHQGSRALPPPHRAVDQSRPARFRTQPELVFAAEPARFPGVDPAKAGEAGDQQRGPLLAFALVTVCEIIDPARIDAERSRIRRTKRQHSPDFVGLIVVQVAQCRRPARRFPVETAREQRRDDVDRIGLEVAAWANSPGSPRQQHPRRHLLDGRLRIAPKLAHGGKPRILVLADKCQPELPGVSLAQLVRIGRIIGVRI